MFKNFIVGVDGSETSLKAAAACGEMARCTGAESVVVVVCYEPVSKTLSLTDMESEVGKRIFDAREIYAKAVEAIGEIGTRPIPEILEGPAADAILKVAEVRGCELIIMGTRGLGHLAGLVMGSQSLKVATNACCPVMIVR